LYSYKNQNKNNSALPFALATFACAKAQEATPSSGEAEQKVARHLLRREGGKSDNNPLLSRSLAFSLGLPPIGAIGVGDKQIKAIKEIINILKIIKYNRFISNLLFLNYLKEKDTLHLAIIRAKKAKKKNKVTFFD
jgi:hypothetical protein